MAVREMAAVREIHAEDRVAGLQNREINRHVGLAARVRLNVDMLGAEKLFRTIDGEALDHVGELAAAVVAAPGISLGVLVGEDGARRFEYGLVGEVL